MPEAEAKVHHVLLCEGASLPKRANTAPEKQAEAWEVCRHQGATLGAGGHPDHGSKCRKRLQGLQRNPNGATMVRMVVAPSSCWPRQAVCHGAKRRDVMRMSVLLLLVTIVAILIPSEAQAKRYRIEQTGSHSWTVTDDAELLDDPDRFAFGTDPQLLRAWGTDPEKVCEPPPKMGGGYLREDGAFEAESNRCTREGGEQVWTSSHLKRLRSSLDHAPECEPAITVPGQARREKCLEDHRSHVSVQIKAEEEKCAAREAGHTESHACLGSYMLDGLRRQLAVNERGDDRDCDADRILVYKLGHVTSYEYQRGVLGPVHTIVSPVPDFPALVQARAALKTCLESHHKALTAKIKAQEEECAAKQVAEDERKRRIAADNEKCRADLAARIQERVEKAPTRPITEIEAIPPRFRLPEEVQRMEDFAAAQAAKKAKGHKKPKPDK